MTAAPQSCQPDIAQAMAKFVQWAMQEGPWDGLGLDGGDIQDKALELGLIERNGDNPEGWFVLSEPVLACLTPALSLEQRGTK